MPEDDGIVLPIDRTGGQELVGDAFELLGSGFRGCAEGPRE